MITSWNPDDFFVDFTLDEPLKVWIGIAASIRVLKQKCILKGGGEQIWINPEDIANIALQPKRTSW